MKENIQKKNFGNKMDITKDFNDFFETLNDNNYFSYLSFTGKNEFLIRDNFAYFLNERYNKSKLIAREYSLPNKSRADLVIFDLLGNPEIIIEFKACFTFTIENNIQKYVKKIRDDHSKNNCIKGVQKYFILLVTNPYNLPEPEKIFEKIFKQERYRSMKSFIKKNPPETYFVKAQTLMNNEFEKTRLKIIFSKEIKLGKAFDVECGLYCFILKEK
jgi:hypothetical protein